MRQCSGCEFYEESRGPLGEPVGQGLCFRFPPKPQAINPTTQISLFPIVQPMNWCGEFQERHRIITPNGGH